MVVGGEWNWSGSRRRVELECGCGVGSDTNIFSGYRRWRNRRRLNKKATTATAKHITTTRGVNRKRAVESEVTGAVGVDGLMRSDLDPTPC